MKYIDANKLKAEIERRIEEYNIQSLRGAELSDLLSFITSLQQERTTTNLVDVDAVREDFITEVYRVLDADPTNDRANAIIDAFDSLPTVCQEQPKDKQIVM